MFHFVFFPVARLAVVGLAAVGAASLAKRDQRTIVVPGLNLTPAPAPTAQRTPVPAGGYFKLDGQPCNKCGAATGFKEPAGPGMQVLCGSCSGEAS